MKETNNCGECEYSEEQRNIHGESRYECVTCTKLNCGTLRFEMNKRCPLLKALSAEK